MVKGIVVGDEANALSLGKMEAAIDSLDPETKKKVLLLGANPSEIFEKVKELVALGEEEKFIELVQQNPYGAAMDEFNEIEAKLGNAFEYKVNPALGRRKKAKLEHGHYINVRDYPKIGRNEPCPCGSGKKFKKCCLDKQEE